MALSLGQGLLSLGGSLQNIAELRKQRQAEDATAELWSGILKEPVAPAEGQVAEPDTFAGVRKLLKGTDPKTLARVMGSQAFTPQGLKALASIGATGAGGGSLVTGEQLKKLYPNLAEADLKGFVFQQNENGDWIPRVTPKKPIVASPGAAILDASDPTKVISKVPERLQLANISQGGQLRLVDTESGANMILAERAPAPSGGGEPPTNRYFQYPDVDEQGRPIQKLIEIAPGKGGPGRVISDATLGTKAPPKPLSSGEQEDFIQAAQGARALNDMEKSLSKTGRIRGLRSKGAAFLGTDPDAVRFETARNQLKLAAQSLIKGIPSNFDVETVIDTLPSLTQPEPVNRSRIDFTRQSFKDMVQAKIGFYKGLNYQLPADVYRLAQELGVDPDAIQPLTQEQMVARTAQINKGIAAGAQKLGVTTAPSAAPQAPTKGPSIDDLLKKYQPKK